LQLEQQIGDIHTRNQQDTSDRAQQYPQPAPHSPG
jgi:hypothetical protein